MDGRGRNGWWWKRENGVEPEKCMKESLQGLMLTWILNMKGSTQTETKFSVLEKSTKKDSTENKSLRLRGLLSFCF